MDALSAWAQAAPDHSAPGLLDKRLSRPPAAQIIAFSDPSDALTFLAPPIDKVKVVNIVDRNGLDVVINGAAALK